MKVFIAIDSFKGALSSREAGEAAKAALREAGVAAGDIRVYPMSDGGEGFCACAAYYLSEAEWISLQVTGPDGSPVKAKYFIADKTAVIESAAACGYTLIKSDGERPDPRTLTTAGVGEMILDAINKGCSKIVLGLGGTATVDAGLGLYEVLANNKISNTEFIVCTDTFSPMTGPEGAVYMYGPQKGLKESQLAEADKWMTQQAERLGVDPLTPGFGAAGGLAAALAALAPIRIISGADFIIDHSGLKEALKSNPGSLLITGEGRVDEQSLTGKITGRLASLASELGSRALCLAGRNSLKTQNTFGKIIQITPPGTPLQQALDQTAGNIRKALLTPGALEQ